MKYASLVGLAAAMTWLTGCASAPQVTVLEPVGPAPGAGALQAGDGALVIYSAHVPADVDLNTEEWRWNNDFGRNDFLYEPAHSDYVVRSENGQIVKHVRNARTQSDDVPTVVALPAGSYKVEADAVNCDGATVKVLMTAVIKSGQTTMAHLGGYWSPAPGYNETEVAKLPCGKVIGWRAPAAGYASSRSGS